jgi:Cysteine-rich CPXCG
MHLENPVQERLVRCPYCGEPFSTVIDCTAGSQAYVEDCPICCRPIEIQVTLSGGGQVSAMTLHREDE